MKIYVASSWRNKYQPDVVRVMRNAGHEVYDFRNPRPGNHGFAWSQIDENYEQWTVREYREALGDPVAVQGFQSDASAMMWADAGILVLPSGRSSHLEIGFMAGENKKTFIYMPEPCEPELMNKLLGPICVDMVELVRTVGVAEGYALRNGVIVKL